MARSHSHLDVLRAAAAGIRDVRISLPWHHGARCSRPSGRLTVRLFALPSWPDTAPKSMCRLSKTRSPAVPYGISRRGSCSAAVTCAPCAAVQGLFPRPELADGHVNESKRVLAASLPTVHSLLVPQSQTAPVQFGGLRVPSIR
jgi:hypothetical protein